MPIRSPVRIIAGTVFAAACTLTVSSVDARDRNWFMVGRSLGGSQLEDGWRLSELTDSINGVYSGNVCGVTKEFTSKTTLAIFQSVQAKSAFISVSNKDWQSLKSRHGQTTALILKIKPSGQQVSLTANIVGDTNVPELSADIPYADLNSIFQDIGKATELEVVADNRPVFAESLNATNAMQALSGCVSEIETAVSKQRANDPFSR